MRHENVVDFMRMEGQHSPGLYPKRDMVLTEGSGALVKDIEGREYIDCMAGHGVASIGHGNPSLVQAITRQASKLITCPGTFYNDTRAQLLEKLVQIAPPGLNRAFLCNSGTEAVEAAIKFARLTTGKTGFICAMKGFHGRTLGALSATHNPKYRTPFAPLVPGFRYVPYNKFQRLEEAVEQSELPIAGIILEPVQGEGGVHIGDADYFRQVRELCDAKNIMLIIDEVQTGFCRTGKWFGVEHLGIVPDMMCIAKAMAGGLPMGGVLCADKIEVLMGAHGTTFGGNPLACAAASATIDVMRENRLWEQAEEKGRYLVQKLQAVHSPKVRDIRGKGLMIGIELKEKVKPYLTALLSEGVLALPAGATVLRLLPPLTIEYPQLDTVIEKIQKVLA